MIKKSYILYFLVAFLLTGCAAEDWLWDGKQEDELRDYAQFSFAVPEPTIVDTRAGDNLNYPNASGVENVAIFFFTNEDDEADCRPLQVVHETFSSGLPSNITVEYNADLKSYLRNDKETPRVVAVANYFATEAKAKEITSLAALNEANNEENVRDRDYMIMSGQPVNSAGQNLSTVTHADLNKNLTINLIRSAAKATVEMQECDLTKDFTLDSYSLFSSASKVWATAGITGKVQSVKGSQTYNDGFVSALTGANLLPSYGYAQEGYNSEKDAKDNLGADKRAFVIVKGEYKNATCYYRIDLREKDSNGKYKYLFLTPNHYYQIKIVKVRCKGYNSAEEAAAHPQSDFLEVEIHDHVERIMSMTSDGLRELGVTQYVNRKDASGGEDFMLKLFTAVSGESLPDLANATYNTKRTKLTYPASSPEFEMEIITGMEWLSFKNVENAGEDSKEDSNSTSDVKSSPGKVYKVVLDYNTTSLFTGTQEATIRVRWRGLEREVTVIWKKEFDPEKICSVTLAISYSGSDADNANVGTRTNATNYWTYLKNAKGVKEFENVGKIRNQGFHLPLKYGGDAEAINWKYEYVISPAAGVGEITAARFATPQDEGFEDVNEFPSAKLELRGDGKVYLSSTAQDHDWSYLEGKLILTIGGVDYPFDVYRTGFFHYESKEDKKDGGNSLFKGDVPAEGVYYYEVRTIGSQHWLDRNIMASAGGMSIMDSDGNNLIPDDTDREKDVEFYSGSTGAYFLPAKYVQGADAGKNVYTQLTPPGFRIPTVNEWDNLRNSGRLNTSQTTAANTTYYQANIIDDNGNAMYLPKVGYFNDSQRVGDANAGYYWTKTRASGLEKAEVGRWLRSLFLSGASNSYMNGNVETYGMQVRAIAGKHSDVEASQYTVGFKVKGATHVYVYDAGEPWPSGVDKDSKTYDDSQKYGLVTWPGQPIGEASAMENGNGKNGAEFTFTFSTSTPKENLRFLFTFVENGKIRVFERGTQVDKTDKEGTDKYNGWPLADSYVFEFTNSDKTTYNHSIGGFTEFETAYTYVIRWPKIGAVNQDYYAINVKYDGGSEPDGFTSDDNANASYNGFKFLNKNLSFNSSNKVVPNGNSATAKFGWAFSKAPEAGKPMVIRIYRSSPQGVKILNFKPSLTDFNKIETLEINGKQQICKVLDISNSNDFVDDNSDPVVTTTKYRIYWRQDLASSGLSIKLYNNSTWVKDFETNKNNYSTLTEGGFIYSYYDFEKKSNEEGNRIRLEKSGSTSYSYVNLNSFTEIDGRLCYTVTGGIESNTTATGYAGKPQKEDENKEKTLVIRIKATDIYIGQDYIYAWTTDKSSIFNDYNNAQLCEPGTIDGYRYWKITKQYDGTTPAGVILKSAQSGDGAHKSADITEFVTETDRALLSKYGADYLFTIDKVLCDKKDYSSVWVDVLGVFNGWVAENGSHPGNNGLAILEGLSITSDGFKIKEYISGDTWYSNGSNINCGEWVNVSGNSGEMTINGLKTGAKYNVEWDYVNKKVRIYETPSTASSVRRKPASSKSSKRSR